MTSKFLLGTYTRRASKGIYSVELNTETKTLENIELVSEVGNPTYLDTNSDQSIIYTVVSEDGEGGLLSLVRNESGEYERKAIVLDEGKSPCYVALDEDRQLVYTAYYHTGEVMVFKTDTEGHLELVDTVTHKGQSVHENQDGPHAHYSQLTPDNKYLVACDLGTDKVYTYEVSDEGQLTEVATLEAPLGTGPRHLVFHPTLDIAYLFGELSSEVFVLQYDAETGKFTFDQKISSIPEEHTAFNSGAAIRISSDGQFVYASNRGHDSIVIYRTDDLGHLTLVDYASTAGETPRDFDLDPSENYVVVGHQDSDNLTLFEREIKTGMLNIVEKDIEAAEVVCVHPVK